ncbi:TetR/AcrR family transcriptional regulator [Kitasatospora sp. NPDC056138]|uniref:TetR/AcrR family transcriptional regulator n=1 Tax=Kitasatospora sp. NPDC056138 TaxID=3345724 RepID=UPI0035E292E5
MSDESKREARPRRGRPRSTDVDRAVITATVELLIDPGYAELTIEAVASRAGVGRPAVYRRWPTKDDLVVHALIDAVPPLRAPDTGDVLHDLKELAVGFALRLAGSPVGRAVLAVHAEAGRRPELAVPLRQHYLGPRDTLITELIERGVAEGRLNPALAPDTIRDLLFGPLIYHWLLTGHLPDTTADTLAEAACKAIELAPS